MNIPITPLEPLAFPLTGSHLIEASAGTGKTFTITTLYIRLILGHGNAHGAGHAFLNARPLTPPEILVVTFTDAATRELRDRIRARLAEAASYFRHPPASVPNHPRGQDPLHDLRSDFPTDTWTGCARKLQLASEWMDEAAVSTIHGWCNRMLREHAFDSQSLFTQSLETDQTELLAEMVRDYWRNHYYPMNANDIIQITDYWVSPDALEQHIQPLLEHISLLPPTKEPDQILQQARESRTLTLETLKKPWKNWVEEIEEIFQNAENNGLVHPKKFRAQFYKSWLNKIRTWAESPDQEKLDIGTGWKRLTPEGIEEIWIGPPPVHPALQETARLQETLNNLPCPYEDLLAHAARWIASRFSDAQKKRAQMGFNDLLTGLDAALTKEHGERLAKAIRTQFPVAMIDEFQDTDPVQYRIFDRIYEIAKNRKDCSLILIGDPKQAIYAFRGADIYTYLKAREAVDGRFYTLRTNFRSTANMVIAANRCFEFSESQETGRGAFLFRDGNHNPVPFQPVQAAGRADQFIVNNQAIPALTASLLPADNSKILSTGDYLNAMSEICATRIVNWLNHAQTGNAGFAGETQPLVPLKPSDIAILVNNGNEAGIIRQALAKRGIRSVYLSDRDSVYQSAQAAEIHRWLCACAEPDNDRLLRAALSTETLGLSFFDLEELNENEDAWESQVIQFKAYREIWQQQGILPMLRRILLDFGCNGRLLNAHVSLNGISGERILTDVLHLAELLQQASHTLEGEHALIRFLAEQRAFPEGETASRKVRLESDADLVKIVTIHKSKGLEYPIVLLPFICATRVTKEGDVPLKWHNENGELQIALKANIGLVEKADHDRLGEDIRKAYVAITRARYITWMGIAQLKNPQASAIGYLLGLGGNASFGLLATVENFARDIPAIAIETSPRANDTRFTAGQSAGPAGTARKPTRAARENWGINSYSGLKTARHGSSVYPELTVRDDTAQTENLLEELSEPMMADTTENSYAEPVHRFFKGADPGTFLHELLEWIAEHGFAATLEDPPALTEIITRRCKVRRWENWIEPLVGWMQTLLHTPLRIQPVDSPDHTGSGRFLLKNLKTYQAEMEFWFETRNVDLERLDALVTTYTLDNRERPRLLPGKLNGMLKGFIDLVFEHEGKYFIADYKSNWLGSQNDAYSMEAMEEVIRNHRYDLQYTIYLFALHRLLKSRLPDYDYDQHVGGAIYLFMRGILAPSAGVHFERPPKKLIIELDLMFHGMKEETTP